MIVCGVDEAGRGSVVGDLCIGCFVVDDTTEYDAKDSKKVSAKKRASYYAHILETGLEVSVLRISSQELNEMHENGMSLNDMEVWGFTKILNELDIRPDRIVLDACDTNQERFGLKVCNGLNYDPQVISCHRADSIYKETAAASIVAKYHRELSMDSMKQIYGQDIGSGYPSDTKTIHWLTQYYQTNQSFPSNTRLFWSTIDRVKQRAQRATLQETTEP